MRPGRPPRAAIGQKAEPEYSTWRISQIQNIVEEAPPAEPSMLSRPEIRHRLSCRRSRTDSVLHVGNTAAQEFADCSGTSTPRSASPQEPVGVSGPQKSRKQC